MSPGPVYWHWESDSSRQGYNAWLQAGMTSCALWSSSQSLLLLSPQGWRLWFLWVEHVFDWNYQHVTSGRKKWSKIPCNLDNILDSLVLLPFSPNFRREQLQLKSVTYFAASILWSTSSREELWATWKVPKRVFLFFFIFSACEDQTFTVPCFTKLILLDEATLILTANLFILKPTSNLHNF